jgi:hypothetical protein
MRFSDGHEVPGKRGRLNMRRIAIFGVFLVGVAFTVCLAAKTRVPQPGPALLQKVEALRGQPLTAEQRTQFLQAAADLRDALRPAQEKFVSTIAETFNMPEGEVQAMLPRPGPASIGFDQSVIPKIEQRRGRGVTPQELQQIRTADNAKKAEMSEIQSRYTDDLARIAGLSKERIQRVLPAAGI